MAKKKAESAVEADGNMPLNEKNQNPTKKANTTEKNVELPAKKAKVAKPTNEGEENNPEEVPQKKVKKTKKENNAEVPAKKAKLTAPKEEEEEEKEEEEKPVKKPKKVGINKGIFEIFNKLNDKKEKQTEKRVNEMIALLNGEEDPEKRTATCAYALKRLVRCTGADDKDAVASSASYMHAILNEVEELQPIELLRLVKFELPVGPQSKSRDDTLAAVGQMVTALAIIRSKYMNEPSVELIETLYPMLVVYLHGREYLVSLCADIIVDTFRLVNEELFKAHVWPNLQYVVSMPLADLKLQGCNLLLAVHIYYPTVLTVKNLERILKPRRSTFEELFEFYLKNSTIQAQQIYEYLGHFIAHGSAQLLHAWHQHLVKQLPLKRNTSKAYFIQTLSFVLMNYKGKVEPMQKLFEESSLVSLLVQELAAAKQLNSNQNKPQSAEQKKVKASQLELVKICHHFESSLLVSFQHHLDEELKVAILKALLKQQPQLDVMMQTPHLARLLTATIQESSRRDIYKVYASHFTHTNVEGDEEELKVTKADREQCLTQMHSMLQLYPHLMKRNKIDFLLKASLFHLNPEKQPCPAADAAEFSRQAASRCEEILLSCLVQKIGSGRDQLASLVELLRRTMTPLVEQMKEEDIESKLRIKQTPELRDAWKQVKKVLQAEPAEEDAPALPLLFDALILFVGLASLAPSCSIAVDLIKDLVICKQNALQLEKKTKKKKKAPVKEEPELAWEDVLTDVLIQLLLQTGGYWRDFVKAVGGAVMPQLKENNLDQILDVLDMNKNPLSKKQAGEEDDEDDEDEPEEEEEESSSDEDDDEDESDEEDEDEATQLEQIREKVRVALSKDEDDDDDNNDASSVDWNDVDEAEGQRINMALESAFQAFKPKGGKSKQPKQQTKSERIDSTALLHFRIRVLDLVELFTRAHPKMEVMVNAILTVYQVCRVSSADPKMKALTDASKKLLLLLVSTRINYGTEENPDKTVILEAVKQLISQESNETDDNDDWEQPAKKKKGQKQQQQPQQQRKVSPEVGNIRNKCVAYFIGQFNTPNMTKSEVWPVVEKYLKEWVSRRKTPYTLGSFDALFNDNWVGVSYLVQSFINLLLAKTTRNYRRSQILEILDKNCQRIAKVLDDDLAVELHASLQQYEPTKAKDRKIHAKLLVKLFEPEDD